MTVLVNKTRVSFFGDGITEYFNFDFKMLKGSRIKAWVSIDGAEYIEITLNIATQLNTDQELNPGGVVHYPIVGSPLMADDIIVIGRDGFFNQRADYTNHTVFSNDSIEEQLDLAAMERQELKSALGYMQEEPPVNIEANDTLGYQNAIRVRRPKYEVVEDTVLRINGGRFYDGRYTPQILIIPTYIDYDFGDSLSANTWYYLCIDRTEVTGQELDVSMLTHTSSAPAYEYKGYYYNYDLCIMAVLTDGDGNLLRFFHDGGSFIQWENQISEGTYVVSTSTPALVDLDTSVPRISCFTKLTFRLKSLVSGCTIQLYTAVAALSSDTICIVENVGDISIANTIICCATIFSTTRSTYVSTSSVDNEIKVFTNGWYLPGVM